MTEQALQQELDGAIDFLQRQQLLKQLWKLHRQRNGGANDSGSVRPRESSRPPRRTVSRQVQPVA